MTEERGRGTEILRLEDLSVRLTTGERDRAILHPTSVSLHAGETLGLVGESGSGKSLLTKATVGLLPRGLHASGMVFFRGTELPSQRAMKAVRGSKISLLMQDPFTSLNPLQTVGKHLAESLDKTTRGARRPQSREIVSRLREVDLDPSTGRRYPHELSGGMQQRVSIACALAKDPDVLIADEPTTALDATVQLEILELLKSIQRTREMALLLVTHDMGVAEAVSDRLMVMYAGRVMELGPTDVVTAEPSHPYTWGLLRSRLRVDRYDSRLFHIPGSIESARTIDASGCPFAPRCDWATVECGNDVPALIPHERSYPAGGSPRRRTNGSVPTSRHMSACLRHTEIVLGAGPWTGGTTQVSSAMASPTIRPPVLLSVRDLSKAFGRRGPAPLSTSPRVLHGVSLDVHLGESIGLVGESGAGKTTLMRCLLGLSTPDAGSIKLGDLELSDYRSLTRGERQEVRRAIQCVFQDPYASLSPARTVGAALAEAAALAGDRRPGRAHLEMVGLPARYEKRLPAALSGGERQRVAIARALVTLPRMLICDEPVAALDLSVQAQVLSLLRDLRSGLGFSMLLISHDLAVIRQLCDRVYVLDQGRIVEHGPVDEVLGRPRHEYTQRLVRSFSLDDGSHGSQREAAGST